MKPFMERMAILGKSTAGLIILGVVAFLIYADTFQAPFIYDDGLNITNNPNIRMTELSWTGVVDVLKSRSVNSTNRPFAALTIALNYYFHQYRVFGYHLFNLLIHIFTGFLIFSITRLTLASLNKKTGFIPFLAALMWLVNPVHTQSVTYIIQRMNALAAMFYLLSLTAYIQARQLQLASGRIAGPSGAGAHPAGAGSRPRPRNGLANVLFVASTFFAVLALSSKEIALTLPVFLLLYEWFFFQGLSPAWLKRQAKWLVGGLVLIALISLIYLDTDPVRKILSGYANKPFTPGQRLLSEPSVIIYYLSLLIFPHPARLHLVYDFPVSASLLSPSASLLAIAALIALIVFAFYSARQRPLIAYAVLWFLGTLVIESSVIGLELIYEHRTYLPSVFPFIAGTCWFLGRRRSGWPIFVVFFVIIVICGFWTRQRNHMWQDEIRFWRDAVAKAPSESDNYNSLGLAFQQAGDYEQALVSFEQARQLEKNATYDFTAANIGEVLIKSGRYREAVPFLEKVVANNIVPENGGGQLHLALPDEAFAAHRVRELYKKVYLNLGIARQQTGRTDEAISYYRCALAVDPRTASAWNNMGNAFFRRGDVEQAVSCFKKALAVDPAYEQAAANLKKIDRILNRYGPIISQFEAEADQAPGNAQISFQLGRIYQAAGMIDRAIEQYDKTVKLNPGMIEGLNLLAVLYAETGQDEKATGAMEKLAEMLPENETIYYNLACLYARQNRTEKAVTALRTAVEKGYDRWGHIKSDPDLASIRHTPYYRELVSLSPP